MAGASRVRLGSVGSPRGEGASRGPERNDNGRPQFVDCVRMVHVIKDINKLVLDALRLRTAMSRRGKAGRKKKRGRKGAKSKAAAALRPPSQTISLRAFRGSARTTLRAGLAWIVIGSPVNGF